MFSFWPIILCVCDVVSFFLINRPISFDPYCAGCFCPESAMVSPPAFGHLGFWLFLVVFGCFWLFLTGVCNGLFALVYCRRTRRTVPQMVSPARTARMVRPLARCDTTFNIHRMRKPRNAAPLWFLVNHSVEMQHTHARDHHDEVILARSLRRPVLCPIHTSMLPGTDSGSNAWIVVRCRHRSQRK